MILFLLYLFDIPYVVEFATLSKAPRIKISLYCIVKNDTLVSARSISEIFIDQNSIYFIK